MRGIKMERQKKSKAERKRDREIVELYHKKITEGELETLYTSFQEWKSGKVPYYELTEAIHEFHKKNQKIWSRFNYSGRNDELLIIEAKKELNLLNDEEKERYAFWLKE
jgi:hypothetical protein